VWQALREELRPHGVEVVTVALDTGGAEDAGPWIDAAKPRHPALIDEAHRLDEVLGITNVPMGVWIDEHGILVRPPEVAHPGTSVLRDMLREHGVPKDAPPLLLETLAEASKIRVAPERYAEALRDWALRGAESPYALSPDEVVERSRPRPLSLSEAAAHFELGQHLHRAGDVDGAREHFRAAHRLDPANWTYKRQAWSMEDPLQGPTEHYDSDWLTDVRASGAESYYAVPDLSAPPSD
jgi:tetratricopeptide (TPR) repeat protein